MSDQIDATRVAAAELGAPSGGLGLLDPQRCGARAMTMLQDAAGEGLRLTSFSLEMGSVEAGAGDALAVYLSTDKRTHAIAFLSLEARAGNDVAFTARAVFSVR